MNNSQPAIVYTLTDEAPALATAAFLPIVRAFTAAAGIDIRTSDISVAARILAEFPEALTDLQRVPDNLAALGKLTLDPEANIIKLPNISASVFQLQAAIKELQADGYPVPDFPEDPQTDEQKKIRARYGRCLGSAVNPVLREGNSDRRAPRAVKAYARKHPHSMGDWSMASRTHVAHMRRGDFYHGEKSMTLDRARDVKMELVTKSGKTIVLKPKVSLQAGEIIDSMFMSKQALCDFYEAEMEDARQTGVMFSLHVKATMMKVSHPIVFGHAVRIFYKDAFEKHAKLFDLLGVNVNNGLANLYDKLETLPTSEREEVVRDLHACHEHRPELAMVDSARGISNLHAPNDVIVDASMPAMIRIGGKMWGPDGRPKDTKAVIPESTFARIYQEVINFCKTNGNFDPVTMGTVPNVGLMAQQAEEYGSHDKTFEIGEAGEARITDLASGDVLLTQQVETGDLWRMCQVKDAPIRDWVKLAVERARNSGMPALFWLDPYRPHENELIKKVQTYLKDHDTNGLDIQIMSQVRAMRYTLERVVRGLDTISVTGNILRDYLTDLFPIMELGTSAKMLSIVPLMAGGGHVRNRCRWLGAEACQAVGRREPLALGFAGRIPGAGGVAGRPGAQDRQRAGDRSVEDARPSHRQAARHRQKPIAKDRAAGQPWQPVLPGALLGPGTRGADRGPGPGSAFRATGRDPGRAAGHHRQGIRCRAGQAGRHRRLLQARQRQGRSGDAAESDLQRGAGGRG